MARITGDEMKLTNQGPGDIHLSDGRVVKPGETVTVTPEITMKATTPETQVRVLETD
jgi:ribosomal 50S subunit-recycling heat shock protein